MKINPNTSIFIQLADHIRFQIYSKRRAPGSKMESIREMAVKLEVNPNTIKRVYKELEEEGLIYSRSTSGYFVIEDGDLINTHRDFYISKRYNGFLNVLEECKVKPEDFFDRIKGRDVNGNNKR